MSSPAMASVQADGRPLRVAIACGSVERRGQFQRLLEDSGLGIVLNEALSELFLTRLEQKQVDVLLLDLEDSSVEEDALVDRLLDAASMPVIFSDDSVLAGAECGAPPLRLLRKIMVATSTPREEPAREPAGDQPRMAPIATSSTGELARNVWVLGASLGGPEAVKRFLAALPVEVPVALLLAQHLGPRFVNLLADQLARCTPFEVMTPRTGHCLRHGQLMLAPVGERLTVDPLGSTQLQPLYGSPAYCPSIDLLMADIAERYGQAAGAIVFTGMGDDGARGVQAIAAQGGVVWAQDAQSCTISSMPDRARATGVVSYSAPPEQLAARLVEYLR